MGAVGLLASCGSTPASDDPTPATPRTPPASSAAEISCGEVVLPPEETLEGEGSEQRACLETALRIGRSATLTVTATTIEGDPVTTTWVVTPEGMLTADSDVSRDRFADPSADYRVSCGRVTTLPSPLECPPQD